MGRWLRPAPLPLREMRLATLTEKSEEVCKMRTEACDSDSTCRVTSEASRLPLSERGNARKIETSSPRGSYRKLDVSTHKPKGGHLAQSLCISPLGSPIAQSFGAPQVKVRSMSRKELGDRTFVRSSHGISERCGVAHFSWRVSTSSSSLLSPPSSSSMSSCCCCLCCCSSPPPLLSWCICVVVVDTNHRYTLRGVRCKIAHARVQTPMRDFLGELSGRSITRSQMIAPYLIGSLVFL